MKTLNQTRLKTGKMPVLRTDFYLSHLSGGYFCSNVFIRGSGHGGESGLLFRAVDLERNYKN